MRAILLMIFSCVNAVSYGQQSDKITTIDFVQILNNNKEEAVYYYENNWKVLRDMAIENGYIDSYQILETPYSEDAPFQLMLITTYLNNDQYDLREDHFTELIEERGELSLMNEKRPNQFRKTIFSKDMVKHFK